MQQIAEKKPGTFFYFYEGYTHNIDKDVIICTDALKEKTK